MSRQGSDVVLPRGGLEGRQGRADGHSGDGEAGGTEGNGAGVSGCSRSLEQLNSIVENIPLDSNTKQSQNAP